MVLKLLSNLRFEVSERLNFQGKIIKKLDEKELIKVAKEIKKSDVETLAIVFCIHLKMLFTRN